MWSLQLVAEETRHHVSSVWNAKGKQGAIEQGSPLALEQAESKCIERNTVDVKTSEKIRDSERRWQHSATRITLCATLRLPPTDPVLRSFRTVVAHTHYSAAVVYFRRHMLATRRWSPQSLGARLLSFGSVVCAAATTTSAMVEPAAALALARAIVPSFDKPAHKGSHGRVVVMGGSAEYTGAPYYAGISALKVGADLAIVLCARDAGTPLKAYSPELIVHACLPTEHDSHDTDAAINQQLDRADAVVMGPGLGRDPITLRAIGRALAFTASRGIPTVIDGDALFAVAQEPGLLTRTRHPLAVLTPNRAEFSRLWEATGGGPLVGGPPSALLDCLQAGELSARLGGVTILRKGATDCIAVRRPGVGGEEAGSSAPLASAPSSLVGEGGDYTVDPVGVAANVSGGGSPRRCGGQGDVLAGAVGTFLAWARRAGMLPLPPSPRGSASADISRDGTIVSRRPGGEEGGDGGGVETPRVPPAESDGRGDTPPASSTADTLAACAVGGSLVTRHAAALAFAVHRRATTTPDIIGMLGPAFEAAMGGAAAPAAGNQSAGATRV